VSSVEAAAAIGRAKAQGVRVTAETCPHYLTFSAEEIDDAATEFKCAPPIREACHRDALWSGLLSGALDLVATDHSPAPPAMKCRGDMRTAWGGIASLEVSLAATWSGLAGRPSGGADCAALITRWMSVAPARLAALDDRKGRIAIGADADFVVWDPDAQWTVEPLRLQQRHKITPYAGRRLRGAVRETYVRGQRVWADDRLLTPRAGLLL
jgi:allantoinase